MLVTSKVHARYIADPPYDFTGSSRFVWALVYAAALGVGAYAFGLPDQARTSRSAWVRALAAWSAGAAVISIAQLATGDALLPRFVVFGTAILAVPLFVVWAGLVARSQSSEVGVDRVLVIADPSGESGIEADIERGPERPAVIVGTLSPAAAASPSPAAAASPSPAAGSPAPGSLAASSLAPGTLTSGPLATVSSLPSVPAVALTDVCGSAVIDAAGALGATLLVLDRHAQDDPRVVAQAAVLHESGVRVRSMTNFCEGWLGKLPLTELERTSLFFDISEVHRRAGYLRAKRALDVVLALLGAVVLVPVMAALVVANRVGNRGPLFYRQTRVGRGGATFTILKFRTMTVDGAGDTAARWTGNDDARVTRLGRYLRVSHLDELPQVLNVLRGDLAIVGPRPEQPHYVEQLERQLPYYGMRHLVRPGITGWAQVKFGYAGDERDALEKLQYEMYYLRNQSLVLDARIVVRTLRSVFGGSGSGR